MLLSMTLVSLTTISAFTDLWKDRISNWLVLNGIFLGFLIRLGLGGPSACGEAMLSLLTAFLMLMPLYLIGGIGAGDVKLFACIAVYMCVRQIVPCILIALFVGGVFGLVLLLYHRRRGLTIHFAVPILISVLLHVGGLW